MEEVESEKNELNKQCLYRKNSENPFFRQRNGAAAATQCRMWRHHFFVILFFTQITCFENLSKYVSISYFFFAKTRPMEISFARFFPHFLTK